MPSADDAKSWLIGLGHDPAGVAPVPGQQRRFTASCRKCRHVLGVDLNDKLRLTLVNRKALQLSGLHKRCKVV